MSKASDFFNSGGGGSVPIRGVQDFDENTPDDYTTKSGERYLRRGVVETDTNTFDTSIWTETLPVTTNSQDILILGGTNRTVGVWSGAYSSIADEVIFSNISSSINSPITVSDDGGATFKVSGGTFPTRQNVSQRPVHSGGRWLIAEYNSGNVITSNDLFDTQSIVATGLAGGNIFGMVGNETAVVVWSLSGVARRSTDGGQTWSNVASLGATNVHSKSDVLGSIFIVLGNNDDPWVSADDGLTWTLRSNSLPVYGGHVYNDGTKFFMSASTQTANIDAWTSTDGWNWIDSGILIDRSKYVAAPTSGILYSNGVFSDGERTSIDGVNWTNYWRLYNVFPYTVAPAPATTGITLSYEDGPTNEIDTVELLQYAGGIQDWLQVGIGESTINQKTQFVRIS